MKIVPINRLLLQPTVQLKWIEQHGEIEFIQPKSILETYQLVWAAYIQSQPTHVVDFLDSKLGRDFQLHEQDEVFSLLVGADYIRKKHPCFHQNFSKPNLIWTIKHTV
jgi:hypothetical protein